MKLSDYVVDFLAKNGITHVFELIGGAITHLIDSTYSRDDINCVSLHHEQAAAFAAEAYARLNGRLGVAMATSGPGALNLATGIGSCYFDSVPCLFLTGQVNTYEYKFDRPVRQIGFQETDIVSIVKPITKFAEMITDANKIRYYLEKAAYLAQSGRPGPVLLDIPMNIQRADIEPEMLDSFFDSSEFKKIIDLEPLAPLVLDDIVQLIEQAKRPMILAGGGVRAARAADAFQEFVEITGIPVVVSLMGLDAIPHNHSAFCGMIGTYGNRYSNLTLANCDLLIVLGSRLDTRQTGTRPDTFARAAKKVHVEIDPHELNAKIKSDIIVNCDVKNFLDGMNAKLQQFNKPDFSDWYNVIERFKKQFSTISPYEVEGEVIDPNAFMQQLSLRCNDDDVICLDVGQNQIWAAQSFELKDHQRMLVSGGMGAMGFALPTAIGAVKYDLNKRAIVITGDGGIQINIQELDVVANQQLPIKIFILNNSCLGMVRQFQEMYFSGRCQSTVIGYSSPDFVQIARAYGISSYSINSLHDVDKILDQVLKEEGPVLVNVKLELTSNVNPKLVVNKPIEDMSPHLSREELKEAMIIDILEEL